MKTREVAEQPEVNPARNTVALPGGWWGGSRSLRNLLNLGLPCAQLQDLGGGHLSIRCLKLRSEVNVHGMGILPLGTDTCVNMTSVFCDAGHPGEGSSGLSAQAGMDSEHRWQARWGNCFLAPSGDNSAGRCTIHCHSVWTMGVAWRRFPTGHTSQKAWLILSQKGDGMDATS